MITAYLLQGPPITENKSQRIERRERIERIDSVSYLCVLCVLCVVVSFSVVVPCHASREIAAAISRHCGTVTIYFF
jgi:hypothetical protein